MGNAYDPLEAVKVDRNQPKRGWFQSATPAPLSEPEAVVEVIAQAPAKQSRWTIKSAKNVSINGCLTRVMPGQVISTSSHGNDVILRLIDQGVEMEEIP